MEIEDMIKLTDRMAEVTRVIKFTNECDELLSDLLLDYVTVEEYRTLKGLMESIRDNIEIKVKTDEPELVDIDSIMGGVTAMLNKVLGDFNSK